MAYKYDVFLSYRRLNPYGRWVTDYFLPFFKPYLAEALGKDVKDVKIFKDDVEIQAGAHWPNKLREALVHSKVMVSIFIPSYFRTEWCLREFALMNHRQKQHGFVSQENPDGLVIPLKINDGEQFPDYAACLQTLDCNKFCLVGQAFEHSHLYLDLQALLQSWVLDVANAINRAPAWDPIWGHEDWVEKPYEQLAGISIPKNMGAPSL